MKVGRKKIICNNCLKEKLHFGLGMCSACLRKFKRQTKPSFYLGTCYSEISRRCKTFDSKRPKYYGKIKCAKEEFINKFVDNKQFLNQYQKWQNSGFKRKFAPSVDRIDNNKDYTLDNIQFIQQNLNSKKDWQYKIELSNYNQTFTLDSQKETAEFLGVSPALISKLFKKFSIVEYDNWTLRRINE